MSKKNETEKNLELPSILAFRGNLTPSYALMSEGNWDGEEWKPVKIRQKSLLGNKSNPLKAASMNSDEAIQSETTEGNPQLIDYAAFSPNCNTLKIDFTLKAVDEIDTPCSCNDMEFAAGIQKRFEEYLSEVSLKDVCIGFARNIASARFAHNNRIGADRVRVDVTAGDETFVFNGLDFDLRETNVTPDVERLAAIFEEGFTDGHRNFMVTAYIQKMWGQPIYPSEVMARKDKTNDDFEKSRSLESINGQAAMTSQKIGNALRTIDVWHGAFDEIGAIPTQTFGAMVRHGRAYRGRENNFYRLLVDWVNGTDIALKDKHFVVAILILGGVFGKVNEKKAKEKAKAKA
ncbi:type I-F CRISPR-associated protein Csy3 [Vibrio crassostreae]|uniref:type I-F CRISPR-associated protein Csy3 n=1 Tax=Vibrio crassostreae TaxID=246167 RepID=UPI001B30E94A|nr:type I-F CRISPR-associated protein Csy3 [Vibrio crassostreae]